MTPTIPISRILVVDDSPIDRVFATRLLEQHAGWAISVAENGEVAWSIIEQEPPDLVVTDLQMPVMNGLDLVRKIKATYPNLPVILITAQGSEAVAAESLREGATSYTPKSFLQKDLVRTCEYVLDLANHITHPVTNRTTFEQRFVLNNDCGLVMPLIEHLQNFMPTWTENFRLQLGMAIGEAMVNAMHHGNLELCSSMREEEHGCCYHQLAKSRQQELPFSDRRISIQAEFNQEQLKISVSDEGAGFDPEAIADPRDSLNVTKLHGRGLLLIRSFMDEVIYNDRGNQITMIKRRDPEQSAC
ncbi:MAG: response regulator [Pirellulaceae bacterium]